MKNLSIQRKYPILRYLLIRKVIVLLAFYEYLNRLMKAVADGKIIGEYTYNGKGQRIIKNIKRIKSGDSDDEGEDDDGGYGHHIIFHYDLAGRLIEETKENGKLIADYIYLNNSPLAMIRKQHHQEETFYYHNDHLGTPKTITDKLKKVVWNVEFDPFGNEIKHNHGRHGQYIRKVKNNLRFTGQYFDKETGLHQNYFRDYDPKTGAYPQSDPIGLLGGMNTYSYGNNPVNWIDPLGLQQSATVPRYLPWLRYLPLVLPALPAIGPLIINPITVGTAVVGGAILLWPSTLSECEKPQKRKCEYVSEELVNTQYKRCWYYCEGQWRLIMWPIFEQCPDPKVME